MHGSAPNLVHVQYRRQILASRGAKESFRGHNIASDRLGKTLATAPPIGANFSCGGHAPRHFRCTGVAVEPVTISFGDRLRDIDSVVGQSLPFSTDKPSHH